MQSTPSNSITDRDRDTYRRDGVVCLRRIFPLDWLTFLAGAVDDAIRNPGPHAEDYTPPGAGGRFFGDIELAERIAAFRRFALESPAAEIAGRIMDSSQVAFFYDQLLVKEPGTSERTPWHQDQPYWAVSGKQVSSVWLPLDPVEKSMSLKFVCGSHRWPEFSPYHFVDQSPYEGTGLPPLPDIDSELDRYQLVSYSLQPGDCLVFQAKVIHGAPGNPSKRRRRALATRWTGDDARYCVRPGEVAIPTADPGLEPGDRLESERFPVVWRAKPPQRL